MEPSFNIGVKSAEFRKKRKGGVLENNIGNRKFAAAKVSNSCSWDSETSDTTESDSVDIEKECLIEKTSFDYEDSRAFAEENSEQILKSLKILTKKALGKPLGKINFLDDDIDNIFLDKPVVFPPPQKNLVNVSVRKFFALDISLDNVVKNSVQEKLVVVKKLFSRINGFGRTSISSKFAGIIKATFTSESSLAQASKKTEEVKILVNSNLKKSSGHSDQAVVLKKISVGTSTEAVHTALSSFGVVVSIKMQLVNLWQKAIIEFSKNQHRALLYTLPIGMTVYDIWNYIGSVIVILLCMLEPDVLLFVLNWLIPLNAVMKTTLVLRNVNMHWSPLGFSKCAECEKLSHISLGCAVDGNLSSEKPSCRPFSDIDKSRLATIYAKHSVLIACSVAFGRVSWAKIADEAYLPNMSDVEKKFAVLESSFTSFMKQISELAKRLDSLMLTDRMDDVVMGKGLGEATSGKTAMTSESSASFEVKRLENILEELSALVL
ncbi:hypothetical protein G9A89_021076 [Geosiphon pyriformis]|nr:hypothetical protein G9A89_021076 [Geosiphon pyriformis]